MLLGAVADSIKSLKYNREARRKSTYFTQKKSLHELEQEMYPDYIALDTSGEIDPIERQKWTSRAQKVMRRRRRGLRVIGMISVLLVGSLAVYLWPVFDRYPPYSQTTLRGFEQRQKDFDYSHRRGLFWLSLDEYKNAAFRFHTALEVFPMDRAAKKGLDLAILGQCAFEQENCEKAMDIVYSQLDTTTQATSDVNLVNERFRNLPTAIHAFIEKGGLLYGPGY